jgi:hypothetical protein
MLRQVRLAVGQDDAVCHLSNEADSDESPVLQTVCRRGWLRNGAAVSVSSSRENRKKFFTHSPDRRPERAPIMRA